MLNLTASGVVKKNPFFVKPFNISYIGRFYTLDFQWAFWGSLAGSAKSRLLSLSVKSKNTDTPGEKSYSIPSTFFIEYSAGVLLVIQFAALTAPLAKLSLLCALWEIVTVSPSAL